MTNLKVFFCFWQDIQDDIEDELSFEELVLLRSIAQKRAVIRKVLSHNYVNFDVVAMKMCAKEETLRGAKLPKI